MIDYRQHKHAINSKKLKVDEALRYSGKQTTDKEYNKISGLEEDTKR